MTLSLETAAGGDDGAAGDAGYYVGNCEEAVDGGMDVPSVNPSSVTRRLLREAHKVLVSPSAPPEVA